MRILYKEDGALTCVEADCVTYDQEANELQFIQRGTNELVTLVPATWVEPEALMKTLAIQGYLDLT